MIIEPFMVFTAIVWAILIVSGGVALVVLFLEGFM